MHDQTAQVDDLRLVALPSAVNCADLFVRFTLVEWQVQSMLRDVRAATKRLVQAVVGDDVDPRATPSMLTIRLRLTGGALAVEIEDDRATPPLVVPRELAGRGSGVITLSSGRQLIWCELPLPTGMDATVVPLPRRGTTRAAAARHSVDIADPRAHPRAHPRADPGADPNATGSADDLDPATMQRILNALRRDPRDPPR